MAERRGGQQFKSDVRRQLIAECDTELGVAVDACGKTGQITGITGESSHSGTSPDEPFLREGRLSGHSGCQK